MLIFFVIKTKPIIESFHRESKQWMTLSPMISSREVRFWKWLWNIDRPPISNVENWFHPCPPITKLSVCVCFLLNSEKPRLQSPQLLSYLVFRRRSINRTSPQTVFYFSLYGACSEFRRYNHTCITSWNYFKIICVLSTDSILIINIFLNNYSGEVDRKNAWYIIQGYCNVR